MSNAAHGGSVAAAPNASHGLRVTLELPRLVVPAAARDSPNYM